MNKIDYTLIGYLNSARFLADELDQPTMAKDLLKYEIIEIELATLRKLKKMAHEQNIALSKVWKEFGIS